MKPVLCELFQLKGRRKKKRKHLEGFKVLRDQIETWGYREFEDCNMEGSLNGGKKKKLKPSGIAWENREFESYPPSCSTVSQ